jgi:hypothetical protein
MIFTMMKLNWWRNKMSNKHSQDHSAKPHSHYFKDVSQLDAVDVYRVLELFNVTNPCIQHAVKKLLVAGGRGAGKDIDKDIQEAIDSLERWKDMRQEENPIFNRRSTDKIAEVEFPIVEPKREFEVGDKVRIIKPASYVPAKYLGTVGKISKVYNQDEESEHYLVKAFDDDGWFFIPDEIQRV